MANSDDNSGSQAFGKPQLGVFLRLWRGLCQLLGRGLILLFGLCFLLTHVYSIAPPPVSNFMIFKVFKGRGIDYRYVPIQAISPHLARAVVAAEDTRFCEHGAIDWQSLQFALQDALSGQKRLARGASTLTMQVARNLFLWPGRSYLRKVLEVPIAIFIDAVWSKQRILEIYLNIAEFGPGIYGAEAGARHHFGKSAAKISVSESIALAAVLPNPIKRIAGKPGPETRRYSGLVKARMVGLEPFLSCLDLKSP